MYWTLKHILTWLAGVIFIGVILFYAYYQSRSIIAGPGISVETPRDNSTVTSALVEIRGTATRAKELTLDGRAIFVDLEGRFDEQLLLADGYNIIELAAKDGEGRETRRTLELVYRVSSSVMVASSTEVENSSLRNP